jgi:polyisoprenoid-binding protein YceI
MLRAYPKLSKKEECAMSTSAQVVQADAPKRTWKVDPSRSTVDFSVPTAWGLATAKGRFHSFDGSYTNGPDGPEIELTIDAESLDTGNATRDRHLREDRFFQVEDYPQVRFSSTLIGPYDGRLAVTGQLKAAGHSVPLAFEVAERQDGEELELEATTMVDQRELGMTASPLGMIRTPATLHVRARLVPVQL